MRESKCACLMYAENGKEITGEAEDVENFDEQAIESRNRK